MTTTVPVEVASRTPRRARREVDPGCNLRITPKRGTMVLVLPDRLPDRLIGLPHTTVLRLRLATIARDVVAAGRARVLRSLIRLPSAQPR